MNIEAYDEESLRKLVRLMPIDPATMMMAVGKFIGSIPVVKEGQVDELLQDGGVHLKENVQDMQKSILEAFAALHNPGTGVFMDKMEDMIQIYNHMDKICFDDKKIYLIAG